MVTMRESSGLGAAESIDRRVRVDPRRLYLQVSDAILEMVTDERLGPGDPIPGEPELSKIFDVGRSTVREALVSLENAGLIERSQGSRTVLTSLLRRPEVGLERLEPFEMIAARRDMTCETTGIAVREDRADADQAANLRVEEGSDVTIITRTKTLEGRPSAYMISCVPAAAATAAALRSGFVDSITRVLTELLPLRFAEAEVNAVACPADLAKILEVAPGSPLTMLTERCYAGSPQPVVWNVNYFVPGTFRLEMLRKVPIHNYSRATGR